WAAQTCPRGPTTHPPPSKKGGGASLVAPVRRAVARVRQHSAVPAEAAVGLVAVEELGAVGAALLEEPVGRAAGARLAHAGRELEIAAEPDDRARQRLGLARRDEEAGDTVFDELAEAADLGGDHRPRALHR